LRHAVKIVVIVLGLGVLFWWGWSGNFIFKQGALFRLNTMEDYYSFSLGNRNLGYTKRVVNAPGLESAFYIREESIITLPVPGLIDNILLRSESHYKPDGRLISTAMSLANLQGAEAKAIVNEKTGLLDCSFRFGDISRSKSIPLPKEGPILVSGVVPWLSRQSEVPLGKVLFVELLDFSKMEFEPSELTVTDETAESSEIQLFKVAIKTPAGEAAEWMDANGHMTRQDLSGLEMSLTLLLSQKEIDLAKESLDRELPPIPYDRIPNSLITLLEEYLPAS
jgi:hypothetical protein